MNHHVHINEDDLKDLNSFLSEKENLNARFKIYIDSGNSSLCMKTNLCKSGKICHVCMYYVLPHLRHVQ
jgi:hypothetical protein